MSPVRPWPEAPFAGVAHLVERDLAKVEVASSSLVARSKKRKTPERVSFFGSGLLGALVVSAVFQPTIVGVKNGTLPFFRLASSATGSASAKNMSPANRYATQMGGVLFLAIQRAKGHKRRTRWKKRWKKCRGGGVLIHKGDEKTTNKSYNIFSYCPCVCRRNMLYFIRLSVMCGSMSEFDILTIEKEKTQL